MHLLDLLVAPSILLQRHQSRQLQRNLNGQDGGVSIEVGRMMYQGSSGGGGAGLLGVPECSTGATPRTPEILNSLISMTNPFDRLVAQTASSPTDSSPSPPSVQSTCSQLIKEGLKLTLQTKRRNHSTGSGGSCSPLLGGARSGGATSPESQHCDTSNDGLTPEDEERRRRRRERNKIAATKCRQKKRERTNNLVYESEALETQNLDLKSKIQELEKERRKLVDVLSVHQTSCTKHSFSLPSLSSAPTPFQEYMSVLDEETDFPGCGSSSYPGTSSSSYAAVQVCSSTTETSSGGGMSYLGSSSRCTSQGLSYTSTSATNPSLTPLNYLHHKEIRRNQPIISYYHRTQTRSEEMLRTVGGGGCSSDYPGPPYPLRLAGSSSSSDYESTPPEQLMEASGASPGTHQQQRPQPPPPSSVFQLSSDLSPQLSYSTSSSSSIYTSTSCIT